MIWFGLVLWYINPHMLLNVKSCFYTHIYVKYVCLVWLGFMVYQQLLVI